MKPQFVVFTAARRPTAPLHLAIAKDSEEGDEVVVSSHSDSDGKSSLRVWNMKASIIPVELLSQGIVGTSRQEQREPLHTIEITGSILGLQLSTGDKYLAVILDKYVEIYGFEQLMLQSFSNASFLLQRIPILSGMSNFTCSWSKNVYDSGDGEESCELLVLLFGEDVLVVSPVDGVLSSACVRDCRCIDWMPQINASNNSNDSSSSSENQQSGVCSGMLLALSVDDQVLLMDPLHHTDRAEAAAAAAASSSEYLHTYLDRTIRPNDDVSTDDTSRGFSVVATFRPICKSHGTSSLGLVMHVHWVDPMSILLITAERTAGTTPGRKEAEMCYNLCVLEIPEVLLQWSSGQSLSHGNTIDVVIVDHTGDIAAVKADDDDGTSLPLGGGRGRDGSTAASTVSRRRRRAQLTQLISLPSFSSCKGSAPSTNTAIGRRHLPEVHDEGNSSHESPRFFTGLVDRHSNPALAYHIHACKGHEQLLFVACSRSDVVHMISTETTTATSGALTTIDRNLNKIEAGTASSSSASASSSSASALTGISGVSRAGRLFFHPTVSRSLVIPSIDANASHSTDNGAAGGGGIAAGGGGGNVTAAASFSLAEMVIIDHQKVPVNCHVPRSHGGNHHASADRSGDSFHGINSSSSVDHSVLRADPLLLLRDGPSGAVRAVAVARSVFPLHLVDPATPAAPSLPDIMTPAQPSSPAVLSLSPIHGGSNSNSSSGGETALSPFTGNVWETPEELSLASAIAADSKTLIDAFSTRVARLSAVVVDGSLATPLAIGAGINGRSNLGEKELPPMRLDAQNKVAA